MSTETLSSASPAVTAPVQGANPVPRIETRGENDFQKQISEQGGAQKTEHVETQTPVVETPVTPPTKQDAATTTVPPANTSQADAIRAAVEATAAAMDKRNPRLAQQTPSEKPLSDAEFYQKYGIPSVNTATMQAILDADPVKGAIAMQNLIIQAVRSGALIAKDVTSLDIQKMRGEFEPDVKSWREYNQQRAIDKVKSDFYAEHKDLVGEEALVDEMSDAVRARIATGAYKPSSQKEVIQTVADAARKLLTRMRPAGATPPANGTVAASTSAQPATRQMSAASSAGRSGTGQPQKKSDVEEVFGADAR